MVLATVLACIASTAAAVDLRLAQSTPYPEVVFGCQFDAGDEILGHICRRASQDAREAGAEYGLEVSVAEPNSVSGVAWGHGEGFIQLVLLMEATRPDSQFGQKIITCTLDGHRMPRKKAGGPGQRTDPAERNVSFEATGVPRDLVHPVADAVERLVRDYFTGVTSH